MADDFLLEFIDESHTHLGACEGILLGLKPGVPVPVDEINAAFRALHTIKGGAGFLEQERIQRLAHAGEQLLDALRSGTMGLTSNHVDALLKTVSDLRALLEVAQGIPGADVDLEPTEQIARLKTLVAGSAPAPAPAAATTTKPPIPLLAKRTLEGWVGELTSSDPSDLASLGTCLDGMAHELGDSMAPAAKALTERMRSTLAEIATGDAGGFDRLLALAGDLLAVVASDPRTITQTPAATAVIAPRPLSTWLSALTAMDSADGPALVMSIDGLLKAAEAQPLAPPSAAIISQIRLLQGQFRHSVASPAQGSRFRRLLDMAAELQRFQGTIPLSTAPTTLAQHEQASSPAALPEPVTTAHLDETASVPGTVTITTSESPSALLDFMAESIDLLADAERTCLATSLPNLENLNAIFRCFHTIKGMASYLDQPVVESDAHSIETRLLPLRDSERKVNEEDRAYILTSIDRLRTTIACLTDTPGPSRLGDILVAEGVSRPALEETAKHLKPGQRLGEALVSTGVATPTQVDRAVALQQVQQNQQVAQQSAAKAGADGFSRVATSKLEDLMNLVGELLISQSLIVHDPDVVVGSRLQQEASRQSRIIRDLQVLSLSLRMVPLRSTFQKLARAVHDTARKCAKEVEFVVVGEDTEVDRTLAEAIADPLLHMVRNGVDHGIETPDRRTARGKAGAGILRLSACHAGDNVVISLSDDGNGMDPEKLKAKAMEKGLIAPDAVLTDVEAYDLIFLPGFSTAAAVTNVSGRGVGMDVVRRAVEAAKGTVGITSALGKGSTFTIRLPLTTAILDAMLLRSGDRCFLLPVQSIIEAVRPAAGQTQTILAHDRVLQSRGKSMPIVHLGELFGIENCQMDPEQSIMLVLEDGGEGIALQVDDILGQQQVVIKPLSSSIPHHAGVSGTAILGDGRVGLILDPTRLAGT